METILSSRLLKYYKYWPQSLYLGTGVLKNCGSFCWLLGTSGVSLAQDQVQSPSWQIQGSEGDGCWKCISVSRVVPAFRTYLGDASRVSRSASMPQ
jgi:hypothetical protein